MSSSSPTVGESDVDYLDPSFDYLDFDLDERRPEGDDEDSADDDDDTEEEEDHFVMEPLTSMMKPKQKHRDTTIITDLNSNVEEPPKSNIEKCHEVLEGNRRLTVVTEIDEEAAKLQSEREHKLASAEAETRKQRRTRFKFKLWRTIRIVTAANDIKNGPFPTKKQNDATTSNTASSDTTARQEAALSTSFKTASSHGGSSSSSGEVGQCNDNNDATISKSRMKSNHRFVHIRKPLSKRLKSIRNVWKSSTNHNNQVSFPQ